MRPLAPLVAGDTVRLKDSHGRWTNRAVVQGSDAPWSYNMNTELGAGRRRNRRDIRLTPEWLQVQERDVPEYPDTETLPRVAPEGNEGVPRQVVSAGHQEISSPSLIHPSPVPMHQPTLKPATPGQRGLALNREKRVVGPPSDISNNVKHRLKHLYI